MADRPTLNSDAVARALHGAFCRGASSEELLGLAASKMHAAGPPYDGVHMFSASPTGNLRLIAESGHSTDPGAPTSSSGMRQQAVIEKTNLYVPRFDPLGNHPAQRGAARSLLVVLIRRHNEVLGEIQIESELPDGFNLVEQSAVVRVANALAVLL
ncbi:MAG: hypothetical protein AMS18_03905 [Gemmatimonas sp. SG8_17]|nr:MAG: hypothetical protein AMS18_03905 [Gemmatimonas sp. SG8_17]